MPTPRSHPTHQCPCCSSTAHPLIKPIQCIVPPHMLDVIIMRGDAETAQMARELLHVDKEVRSEREAKGAQPLETSEGPENGFSAKAFLSQSTSVEPKREIYDGQQRAGLPGHLVRAEGDPATGDQDVDDVYDGAGAVHALYAKEFGRDSLDGMGMKLVATVHHRRNYANAFWNGSQMAYGDGDGKVFARFTELSVIAHEMSHGVVQFSGGLAYQGQSGALNESFADCFGAMIMQYKNNESARDASWLIGEGIFGPTIKGKSLRSMRAPGTAYDDPNLGKDPQPYHMDIYVDTQADNGGVHINSGIPNHAFYLYCQYLGGESWKKAGQVWYRALQTLNNPYATFNDWADKTYEAAITLYGIGSEEAMMARRSWKLVGIDL